MLQTRNRSRGIALLTFGTALTFASIADANSGIALETVSDYTYVCGGGSTACNTNANTEGAGFMSSILVSGSPWHQEIWYEDSAVYDTDFYDPDMTGFYSDNDTNNFDPSGVALSFVIAHGSCTDITSTPCTSTANCGANSYCPNVPLSSGQQSVCINESSRVVITSSPESSHGNLVQYGTNPGNSPLLSFALGEDANSGAFDGAGTDGSTNVAIITNSCGFRSHFLFQDTARFFGGLHLLLFNMPAAAFVQSGKVNFADVSQWSARGSNLATFALSNLNAPASSAWLTPTQANNSYLTTCNSPPCSGTNNSGANVVMAEDPTSSQNACNRISGETWNSTLNETQDETGSGWFCASWTCNFSNCSSFSL
jgi:hypothetical protein